MDKLQEQRQIFDQIFAEGSRPHVTSKDPIIQYITRWRLSEAFRRLACAPNSGVTRDSSILVLCAGEGFEGSVLCDLGFYNVTVSDLSPAGVKAALDRDSRLKGVVLNAEDTGLEDHEFDVVIIQDGLHHLPHPVQGFTEMLRVSAKVAIFLEPHDSLIGNIIGTKWEKHGNAVNYVFRWTTKLTEDVACSCLGQDSFDNLSFSFWHHNVCMAKFGRLFGGSMLGLRVIQFVKLILRYAIPSMGNQFCGLILKKNADLRAVSIEGKA